MNEEQKLAVEHFDGPCIVTAAPGSGKTSVLTQRVIRLIQNGISAHNILCLTFTNKAANEMKDRISRQISKDDHAWIGTFHKLCVHILRQYGHHIGISKDFSIYDQADQEELMTKAARLCHHSSCDEKDFIKILMKDCNMSREETTDILQSANMNVADKEVISIYLNLLSSHNAIDFSGLLYKAWKLLTDVPDVLDLLVDRFKYVLVDEGQDTNSVQYYLIKLLARHNNLFIVADPQQGIYSFRGAKPENVNLVKDDFQNVKEIFLPQNYRSTSHILELSQRLIRNNDNAKDVVLKSVRGNGYQVKINSYFDAANEANSICSIIKNLSATHGYKWSDFAVLYRTNYQSRIPEQIFRQNSIPYRIYGGLSFFNRSEVKTAVAYLTCLTNPHDTVAFARAIQSPKRNVAGTIIGKIEKACEQNKTSDILAICKSNLFGRVTAKARASINKFANLIEKYRNLSLNGSPLDTICNGLISESGLYAHIEKTSKDAETSDKKIDNLKEFLTSIVEYKKTKPNATVLDYIQAIQLMNADDKDEPGDRVKLMTIHAAKGLEFPVVFAIGVEKGVLPHYATVAETGLAGEQSERRLLYVCMTRAKDHLYISYSKVRTKYSSWQKTSAYVATEPSQFIFEIDPEHKFQKFELSKQQQFGKF